MKHLLRLLIAIFCIHLPVLAQETDLKKVYTDITTQINSSLLTRKGAYELGGLIFYNRQKTTDNKLLNSQYITETFQANLDISYFPVNNLSAGLLFAYLNQTSRLGGRSLSEISQTSAGPLLRYYFGKERWRPFLLADYLFYSGDVGAQQGEANLGAGILYHLAGNTGLTLQITYGISVTKSNEDIDQNKVFVGIGLTTFIL